jgi:hypothetical protein
MHGPVFKHHLTTAITSKMKLHEENPIGVD